jgi:hypothetical protein
MSRLNMLFPLIIYTPSTVGIIYGGTLSGYKKYQETKKINFADAYSHVVYETITGSLNGFVAGTFWFIAIPMLIGRKIEGIKKK